jgi:NADH-quinone oxidoreductase subunit G
MLEISNSVPQYAGITYQQLAKTGPQVPDVGGGDTYYGGTSFQNTTGLGLQYPTLAEQGYPTKLGEVHPAGAPAGGLIAVPTTILYDRGTTLVRSSIIHPRLPDPYVELHNKDAAKLNVSDGETVSLTVNGSETQVIACVNGRAPEGVVLVPRGLGVPIVDGIRPASVKRL